MEHWARRYGKSQVQFLMVCVDHVGVAIEFGRMFDLKGVVNSHIPSRGYMPVGFGQLGCSGFIMSDQRGHFVSRKTPAYLDFGERAFEYVEELLEKNFGILPLPSRRAVAVEEEKKTAEDVLSPDWILPSVGVDSMDHEHEQCEEALSLLLSKPSIHSLTTVMELLTEHFQHEETLMKQSGFGNPGEEFSPFANHVRDHERILDIGYTELGRKSEPKAMTCSASDVGAAA